MKIKQICFVMLAIFFVLASVGVAGCIDVEKKDGTIKYDMSNPPKMRIFVDSETSVMYFYVEQYYDKGSAITVLLNSDGTPKLYDPQTYTGKVYFF